MLRYHRIYMGGRKLFSGHTMVWHLIRPGRPGHVTTREDPIRMRPSEQEQSGRRTGMTGLSAWSCGAAEYWWLHLRFQPRTGSSSPLRPDALRGRDTDPRSHELQVTLTAQLRSFELGRCQPVKSMCAAVRLGGSSWGSAWRSRASRWWKRGIMRDGWIRDVLPSGWVAFLGEEAQQE